MSKITTKLNFVGLMTRFKYFQNRLINTNISMKMKEQIERGFAINMKEYKN